MIETSNITPEVSATFGELCRMLWAARIALKKAAAHTSELLTNPDFVPHSIRLHVKAACLLEELNELKERVEVIERTYIRTLRSEAQR